MAIKQGREYRALQDFSLVPRDEGSKEYRVRGTAIVFNSPTVLWECDGVEYKEIIDRHAFDECDMSDVIFNYNHGGKVISTHAPLAGRDSKSVQITMHIFAITDKFQMLLHRMPPVRAFCSFLMQENHADFGCEPPK